MRALTYGLQLIFRNSQNKVFPGMKTQLKAPVLAKTQSYIQQQYEKYDNLSANSINSKQNFNSHTQKTRHQAGVRESKETLSTTQSLNGELAELTADGIAQSIHNFTFHPSDIQNLPLKQSLSLQNIYKYSNKSIQCVIFYALLFNHLYLQEIKKNLPEIISLTLKSYNLIKKSLLYYDEILIKRQLEEYIFPHSAFRLIENKALALKSRKQWLQNLMDRIDSSLVSDLVQVIISDRSTNVSGLADSQRRNNETSQLKIQELANCLGVRIKLQSQYKISSFGKKKSCICISIKYQSLSNLFQLKKISCYEDRL